MSCFDKHLVVTVAGSVLEASLLLVVNDSRQEGGVQWHVMCQKKPVYRQWCGVQVAAPFGFCKEKELT